jgi:UDP-N-acetylglucosamine/UDP-N-acetylgalactosamine diphosphorylase
VFCLQRVDLDAVARAWQQLQATPVVTAAPVPFPNIVDATSSNQSEAYRHAGLKLVAQGKAATILMAGGAGTRLGFAHPKGMYDIQLPSHRSLFEMQAERLLKVCADAAQQEGVSEVHVPYYVMTSDGTHEETVQFWRDHQYFGIPAADVFFFQQGMLPALSFEGKILLETSHSISWAANGNGGLYEALDVSGALADMQKRGVEYVEVFCVDNALVRVADPFMFGFCALNRSQCVNKTVEKVQPKEGVGVMCLRSANDTQVASVIEYSEMSSEMAALKDSNDSSKLAFRAANIAIHCLSLPFLQTCAARRNELPYACLLLVN